MDERRGGSRPGSGRKPSAATELRRQFLDLQEADAEYAYKLHVKVMRNTRLGYTMRLAAAAQVMDRVWGKPTQPMEVDTTSPVLLMDEREKPRDDDDPNDTG